LVSKISTYLEIILSNTFHLKQNVYEMSGKYKKADKSIQSKFINLDKNLI
jgi:hypothetical protein